MCTHREALQLGLLLAARILLQRGVDGVVVVQPQFALGAGRLRARAAAGVLVRGLATAVAAAKQADTDMR